MSTNDDSTLTDSFLPSASQMRESGELEGRRRRELEREGEGLVMVQRGGSRRQSPDRKSLMFSSVYDGGSHGGSVREKGKRWIICKLGLKNFGSHLIFQF